MALCGAARVKLLCFSDAWRDDRGSPGSLVLDRHFAMGWSLVPGRLDFSSTLCVLHKNAEHEPEPEGCGGEETKDRQTWVTQYLEARRHAHQQGGTNNQRGKNHPGGYPVCDLLHAVECSLRVNCSHFHFDF